MTGRPACGRLNYCRHHVAHHQNNQFVDFADLGMTVLAAPAGASLGARDGGPKNRRSKIAEEETFGTPVGGLRARRAYESWSRWSLQPTDEVGCRQLSTTLLAMPRA